MTTLPSPPSSVSQVSPESESWAERYARIRRQTEALCRPLHTEDYVVQSMPDVSPTKWHLAHVSWFFETFVLREAVDDYHVFDASYEYLFNSYYNRIGPQHPRPERGLLTRPTVREIFDYRAHVDAHMRAALERGTLPEAMHARIELGLHHEQQHQELMLMDIKHVLWCNPLRPAYRHDLTQSRPRPVRPHRWHTYEGGLQWVGYDGDGFSYDNERPRHRRYLEPYRLGSRLITCGEYLQFMQDGGYQRPELWLSDGWDCVQHAGWRAPLYWEERDGQWQVFTLGGMRTLRPEEPVCHLSYYEADAFATYMGARLPDEAEWELAASQQPVEGNVVESEHLHPVAAPQKGAAPAQLFGDVWEWTRSPYTPYPGFRAPDGALGEYNGKFMCNQNVLRGGCCATPGSHLRATYRNFFAPACRWQFAGLRLATDA